MLQYDDTGLDDLLARIEKLDTEEHPNVRIHGDYIIVAALNVGFPTIYVGSFHLDQWHFEPSYCWPVELVQEAGITRPIVWITVHTLNYFRATNWLETKLNSWTPESMFEYAIHRLESRR